METQYSIKGTIQQANGKPLADIIVVAYDRDLRDSQPLGNPTETNHLGEYKISYAKEQFKKA